MKKTTTEPKVNEFENVKEAVKKVVTLQIGINESQGQVNKTQGELNNLFHKAIRNLQNATIGLSVCILLLSVALLISVFIK